MDGFMSYVVIPLAARASNALLKFVMPNECYIWFSTKHKGWCAILFLVLMIVISNWGFMVAMIPDTIGEAIRTWDRFPVSSHLKEIGTLLLGVIAGPVLVLLLRWVLKWLWKPTPEMLAHNDAIVNAELKAMEEERLAQEAAKAAAPWRCPLCFTKNEGDRAECVRCGEGCRPLSM